MSDKYFMESDHPNPKSGEKSKELREPELIPYGTLEDLSPEELKEVIKELELREPELATNLSVEHPIYDHGHSGEGIYVRES